MIHLGNKKIYLTVSIQQFIMGQHNWFSQLSPILTSIFWRHVRSTENHVTPGRSCYILNKSENATLQLSIFCEKALDKNIY